jgi:leucyl aminopeptidase
LFFYCSGGISLKPAADMDKMRADMGGAACVVGALAAASKLKLPINVKGIVSGGRGEGFEGGGGGGGGYEK